MQESQIYILIFMLGILIPFAIGGVCAVSSAVYHFYIKRDCPSLEKNVNEDEAD